MKPIQLILQIPEPCYENWDTMQPTGCGRHCAACEKTVVDFTTFSDELLLAWLKRNAGQAICGRLQPSQINRPLVTPKRPTHWNWYAKIAATLLAVQASAVTAFAQKAKRPAITTGTQSVHHKGALVHLQGRLIDFTTQKPVPHFSFWLANDGLLKKLITTDKQGHFTCSVPASSISGKIDWPAANESSTLITSTVGDNIKHAGPVTLYRQRPDDLAGATITATPIKVPDEAHTKCMVGAVGIYKVTPRNTVPLGYNDYLLKPVNVIAINYPKRSFFHRLFRRHRK